MSQFVLVVGTAGDCTACNILKQHWNDFENRIRNLGHVRIEEVRVAKLAAKPGPEWPRDLGRYFDSYPAFIIFEETYWEELKRNLLTLIDPIRIRVLNMHWDSVHRVMVKENQKPEYSMNTIISWVGKNIGGSVSQITANDQNFGSCTYKFKPRPFA